MSWAVHSCRALPLTVVIAVLLVGCGSTPDRTGNRVDVSTTINYGSFGTKADIDCGHGKTLNVGGSNNKLTVTGTCASVSIGGADNTITVSRIDGELSVVGLNNKVTYIDGDPDINDTGTGNHITKR